jgi:hypothetical protein
MTRWLLIAVAATLAALPPAGALTRDRTADGTAFLSGGIGDDEREAIAAERGAFSLRMLFAARRSGAYLADVRVTILADGHKVVFDRTVDGPWLLIDLPLGAYAVEASVLGQTQRKRTRIHPGDRHEMVFYFDAPDTIGDPVEPAAPR